MIESDKELLSRYSTEDDQKAFEELVRRHSNLVFGLCRNLMLRPQDAEDAFQMTFVVLSKKAGKLLSYECIGGWLHETSLRTCLALKRKISRERAHSMENIQELAGYNHWQRIARDRESELIHQEISGLPSGYRDAIVICHLEGKSRAEAARILNTTVASIKGALERARKLLRVRLLRNGIATTAGLVTLSGASCAFAKSSEVVAETLIQSTLQACDLPVGAAASGVAGGTSKMFYAKIVSAGSSANAFVLATGIVLAGLVALLFSSAIHASTSMGSLTISQSHLMSFQTIPVSLNISSSMGRQENRQQEDAQDDEGELSWLEGICINIQVDATNAQLEKIRRDLDLDDEWIAAVQDSLKNEVVKTGKQMASEHKGDDGIVGSLSIESKLRKTMWDLGRDNLPDERRTQYAAYRAQDDKLYTLRDDTGISGLIVFLDGELCLSEPQISRLSNLYSTTWNSSHNGNAAGAPTYGLTFARSAIATIRNEDMQAVLSERQFEIFEAMNEQEHNQLSIAILKNARGVMGARSVNKEYVRSACDRLLDLKINEYDLLVGLTDEQAKLLRFARKGVIAEMASKIGDLLAVLREDPGALGGLDEEAQAEFWKPLITQCTGSDTWQKTLSKAFDSKQLEKIRQREFHRSEMAKKHTMNHIVFNILDDLGLTVEQHEEFVAMMDQQLGDRALADWTSLIYSSPNKRFEEILSGEQWARFKPKLELQRRQRGMTEEAKNK